jgi:hypothetical protein
MRRQIISCFEKKIKETCDHFWLRRLKLKMDSIVMLINEIPWVMAPASLVAGLLVASLIRSAIHINIFPGLIRPFGSMRSLIWRMS